MNLEDALVLQREQDRHCRTSYNLGEPWNELARFWDLNLVPLMEELLAWREEGTMKNFAVWLGTLEPTDAPQAAIAAALKLVAMYDKEKRC